MNDAPSKLVRGPRQDAGVGQDDADNDSSQRRSKGTKDSNALLQTERDIDHQGKDHENRKRI